MQISQIQVAHESTQDRLLMRILTASNEEIRVHLTRRFLRELWPALVGTLLDQLAPKASMPVSAEEAQAAVAKESGNSSFEHPFKEDNPSYPLGSNPLLASEAVLEPIPTAQIRLTFREARERSFNFILNSELMQAFCAMLRAAADKAKWDLELDYGEAPTVSAPVAQPAPPEETPSPLPSNGKKPLLH